MSRGGEGEAADGPLRNFVVEVALLATEAPHCDCFL